MASESVTELAQAVILPPDGGWGWVIVFSSFFLNLLVDGIIFSVGAAFQQRWEEYFDISSAAASLAISMLAGTYQCIGPVVGVLVNILGARKVVMCGAVLVSTGFLLSMFAQSIVTIYLTFGLLAGIGFGFVFMPSIVMVGHYFQRRRALATGIAMCGSGIGCFIFAPLATELNREFNWQNSVLIISGISLHALIFGALFRELEPPASMIRQLEVKEKERERFDSFLDDTGKSTGNALARFSPPDIRISNASLAKPHNFDEGLGSTESVNNKGMIVVEIPMNKGGFGAGADTGQHPADTVHSGLLGSLHQALKKQETVTLQLHPHDVPHLVKSIVQAGRQQHRSIAWDHDTEDQSMLDDKVTVKIKPTHSKGKHRVHRHSRMFSEQYEHQRFSRLSLNRVDKRGSLSAAVSRDNIMMFNRPLSRNDVFYNCSVQRLREYQKEIATSDPNLAGYIASVTNLDNIVEEMDTTGHVNVRQGFRNTLCSLLDVAIFKSPSFLILFFVGFVYMLGFFTPFIFLPRHAVSCGHSERAASFLLSIIGITNIFLRVICGFIADHPKVDALWISTTCHFVAGLSTLAIPYMQSYWLLASYSFVFGAAIACTSSLRSVITVEMLGLDRLNNAYGLTLLACGTASLLGAPIAGWLRDATGHLRWSFYLSGIFMAAAGLIQLPLRRLNNWEFVDDDSSAGTGTTTTSA